MVSTVLADLERSRKRLHYYTQLMEKSGPNPPASLSKWIEIYSERTKQLETQVETLKSEKSQKH